MSRSGDLLLVDGALGFRREGAETPVPIPGDGILVVRIDQGSSITLGSGELRGIRYTYPDGTPVVLTNDETHAKSFRVALGEAVTVFNNDTVNVATATERILVTSQQDIPLDRGNTRLFFAYAPAPVSAFRWFLDDVELFTPTVAGDWLTAPSRLSSALGELAARASVLYSGTTAGSGTFSVVYPTAYANVPVVNPQIVGGTNNPWQFLRLTSSTTTGFTVTAYESAIVDVMGVNVVSGEPTTVNGVSVTVDVHPVL